MGEIVLSLCIPTYNRKDYLKRLLDCIALQAEQSALVDKIEIVVSDNNSSDATPAIAQGFQNAFPDLRFVYNRNSHNEGVVRNLLKTLQLASGKFWAFYGDDDFIPENGLKGMISTILEVQESTVIIFKQKAYKNIFIAEHLTIHEAASRYFYYMGNACTAANTEICKKLLASCYKEIVTTCWPHTHLYFLSMFESNDDKPVYVTPVEVHEEQPKHNNNILNSFYIYDSTFYSLIRLGQLISTHSGETAFSNWIKGGIPNLTFKNYIQFCVQLIIFQKLISNERERSDFLSTLKESLTVVKGFYVLYILPLFIFMQVPGSIYRLLYLHGKTFRSYSKRETRLGYSAIYKANKNQLKQLVISRNSKAIHSVLINKGEW